MDAIKKNLPMLAAAERNVLVEAVVFVFGWMKASEGMKPHEEYWEIDDDGRRELLIMNYTPPMLSGS